jgi:hypothetical protein
MCMPCVCLSLCVYSILHTPYSTLGTWYKYGVHLPLSSVLFVTPSYIWPVRIPVLRTPYLLPATYDLPILGTRYSSVQKQNRLRRRKREKGDEKAAGRSFLLLLSSCSPAQANRLPFLFPDSRGSGLVASLLTSLNQHILARLPARNGHRPTALHLWSFVLRLSRENHTKYHPVRSCPAPHLVPSCPIDPSRFAHGLI